MLHQEVNIPWISLVGDYQKVLKKIVSIESIIVVLIIEICQLQVQKPIMLN